MKAVYVLDAIRTPIGRYGGSLSTVRPDDLIAALFRELCMRHPDVTASVDHAVVGATNQVGEDSRNVARMAVLLAGLPLEVPAVTVNRLCGSGLEALLDGARRIQLGEADVVLVGGVESMTRAPYALAKSQGAYARTAPEIFDTTLGWRFPNPALAARIPLLSMGETAERIAAKWNIGRDEQDAFAARSHQRAVAAQTDGAFAEEIVPVEVSGARKGEAQRVASDECARPDTTVSALARLRPLFAEQGSVTAGNSSPLNDGAAALLLVSEQGMRLAKGDPLGRFVTSAVVGCDPTFMGEGPIPATKQALARAEWRLGDVDLVELNEAFAVQALACVRGLDADLERVNVHGGAIALGHPIGASGARIVVTLLHALRRHGKTRGLCTLCVGVGQGMTALFER